ncbi:ABC-three component system protein [Levilactobacillus namurensis]|uniref:ABC-three component system protein n=1 Tax=Levilactobacillus namurensis TaxID=380393 RepID=UPI002231226D|nr:ABC-three component system protein [Levilactobacillus namurensis]MCW3779762.1 SMEK domain-containing protein [Levilactobacillus namurensis]MDT7019875.1 SMEK domain-containing protein [Levilactobacillus namurensis]WNN65543.1 SMEK domain-containing protein [Levilactobacillus namurensis]
MNQRKIYFDYIKKKLVYLATDVEISGKLNLLDGNVFAESFYRDFLNLLNNWNLREANELTSNYPAIDLVDDTNKIVIQVTSNATSTKVKHTLSRSGISKYTGYRLCFLFIAKSVDLLKNKSFSNPYNLLFDPAIDIMSITEVLRGCLGAKIEILLALNELCHREFDPGELRPVKTSLISEVLLSISKIQIETSPSYRTPRPFDIPQKIRFNNLEILQKGTIDDLSRFNPKLDDIYNSFEREGTKEAVIFQKLISLYQSQKIKYPDKTSAAIFLSMVSDLVTYINMSSNLDESLSMEDKEYYCRVILVDAFIRCKIFEDPEGYSYDSTE